MKYVLEYSGAGLHYGDSLKMTFEMNAKKDKDLVWVTSPTGRKELQTTAAARSHWNTMVKEGWYRVEV